MKNCLICNQLSSSKYELDFNLLPVINKNIDDDDAFYKCNNCSSNDLNIYFHKETLDIYYKNINFYFLDYFNSNRIDVRIYTNDLCTSHIPINPAIEINSLENIKSFIQDYIESLLFT